MFSQVSVHNRPRGYSFTARPCNSAVGTHPTGMLSSCLKCSGCSKRSNVNSAQDKNEKM